jgi:sugar porter (SP) family MFS transporter
LSSKFIYFFGALGGLLFGYDTGIISGALHFLGQGLHVEENSLEEGFVTASLLIGAALGAIIAGKLADIIGRKKSLLLASFIFCVGAVLSGLAPDVSIIIAARIILGFGVGAASALVPMYLSELSPAARRGSLAFLNQLMIVLGILLSYVVNYVFVEAFTDEFNSQTGWRIVLSAGVVPAVLMLLGTLFLPESPRYLVRVGDTVEAKRILSNLRPASAVDREVDEINATLSTRKGNLKELFSKFARPAIIIGAILALLQQFMGVNTVIYYAPKILQTVALDEQGQRLITIGIGLVNVVATIVAISIIDKVNRRTVLMTGGACMAVGLAVLAFVEGTDLEHTNQPLAAVITSFMLMFYIISFGITWGGAMWIVLGEIFPLHVRGIGVGLASMVNWISNFLVTLLFPAALGWLDDDPFIIYVFMACVCLVGVVFVRFCMFETKGKTLEDIETDLQIRAMKIKEEK